MSETKQYDIRIKDFLETPVYSIREKVTGTPDNIARMMNTALEKVVLQGGKCSGPPIVLHYKDEDFNTLEEDLEVAWPVTDTDLSNKVLPPVHAASLVEYLDADSNLEGAFTALYAWIRKTGYHPAYPIREIYNTAPQAASPEQLLIEIIIPLKKEHD